MPKKEPPKRRRRPDFWDDQAKVMHLNNLYRGDVMGATKARQTIAARTHAELANLATPEPDVELQDSELSERERDSAIARERMRREGRVLRRGPGQA
jgi:hypothetical protein